MRPTRLYLPPFFILMASIALAQQCPKWGDDPAALRFLQENKSNGTAADPACVSRAFATLSGQKSNIEALVGLLDFERSTEHDNFKTFGRRYPATGALLDIGKPAIPYLIKAIEENDKELVRTNAAHTLGAIYAPCVGSIVSRLEAEAGRQETTGEQQARLRAAKDYIGNLYPPCKAEMAH